MVYITDCCAVEAGALIDYRVCSECGEHCGIVEDGEDDAEPITRSERRGILADRRVAKARRRMDHAVVKSQKAMARFYVVVLLIIIYMITFGIHFDVKEAVCR